MSDATTPTKTLVKRLEGTPAAHGFRHPAEWERHEATWLGWPHNVTDWPGRFAPIQWVYSEIVKKITPHEIVRILVQDARHEARARSVLRRAGVASDRVEFYRIPTNRGWTRDSGPIFVKRDGTPAEVALCKFHFNAWAKYDDWRLDDAMAEQVAAQVGVGAFQALMGDRAFTLEGGAIDVNGCGAVLTTEECLLDPNVQTRNPGASRAEVEAALRAHLGVSTVLWLGKGIAGDDTHGHVDDICRFVNRNTVVLCDENNPHDENYAALKENFERIADFRLENGEKIEVVPLPTPAPLVFEGRRLPASYANFYVCNGAILVPTFNDPNDRVALGILAECFPGRRTVGVHAVDLIWGLGAIHCLTHEQPSW
jgi:agmatine deiminase